MFRERNPDGRINIGDAQYVECLHTNGALIGAGIGEHICQADFFPNGGEVKISFSNNFFYKLY